MGAQAVRAFMSIGEVLAQLQGEFPDIPVSKIRFLEGAGLIEPQRSPSGYRRFTHKDVERLRYILRAQRDHYLPLRVIKSQLEQRDALTEPGPIQAPPVKMTREELLKSAGIDEELLGEMEAYGLVTPVAGHYEGEALEVARKVAALTRFGLQPRHLRAIKVVVEREAAMIQHAVAPLMRRRKPGAIAEADEVAREISGLLQDLHNSLLRDGVRGVLGR